jgi:pimeloyl-ACP methyl ester carboxylesterase|tara:strand:+ start:695 stop:928 length:234 start_codon:yes stop_codon:yes gene_type:complete
VLKELDPPAIARLDEIQAPTLVVVGELDQPSIVDLGRRVAEEACNAEIAVISGAAHLVNMERPEAFNQAVLAFLDDR